MRKIQAVIMNQSVKYLFVDGASFEVAVSEICSSHFPGHDIYELLNFNRISDGYKRVFYYDCLPAQTPTQNEEQYAALVARKQTFFDKISRSLNCHVHTGFSRFRRRRGQEQKGIDVLLSIEALQHAHQGNMDVACIITSDIDLTPMFDALTQTRVSSELLYQRGCAASELIDSADVSRAIQLKDVGGWIASDFGRKLLVIAQGGGRHEATYTEERTLFGWRFEFGITDQGEHVAFNALRNTYFKGGSAEAIVEEIENNPDYNASLRW